MGMPGILVYKSVMECNEQDCKKGNLFIEGKFVKESSSRYFDYDLKTFPSITDDSQLFLFVKGDIILMGLIENQLIMLV